MWSAVTMSQYMVRQWSHELTIHQWILKRETQILWEILKYELNERVMILLNIYLSFYKNELNVLCTWLADINLLIVMNV